MPDGSNAAPADPKRDAAQAIVDAWRNAHFNNPASTVGDSYFAAEPHLVEGIAALLA